LRYFDLTNFPYRKKTTPIITLKCAVEIKQQQNENKTAKQMGGYVVSQITA